MKTQKIKITGLFIIAVLFTIACDKGEINDSPQLSSSELALVQDDVQVDDMIEDVDASVEDEIEALDEVNYDLSMLKSASDLFICKEVTVDYPDTLRFPKIITIDFGEGCTNIFNGDTITKAGKIIITLTERPRTVGAQRIITFEEFSINGVQLEGTITNTYLGKNRMGYHEVEHQLEGGKITFFDENLNELTYTRDSEFLRERLRTRRPFEDTIYVSGSMWGENLEGVNYSREITDKLTLAHCSDYGKRWVILDGQVVSTVGGEETITDYSNGSCDGEVTVIRHGRRYFFRVRQLHRNHRGGGN